MLSSEREIRGNGEVWDELKGMSYPGSGQEGHFCNNQRFPGRNVSPELFLDCKYFRSPV